MRTPYDLSVARHRFCAWAACRAAQAGSAKAKRHELMAALAHSGVVEFLQELPSEVLTQKAYDSTYCQWVVNTTKYLKSTHNKVVPFGVAAKLISVYLKGVYVLHSDANSRLACLIHPPIDSILLKAVDKEHRSQLDKTYKWQKLNRKDYMLVIKGLRKITKDKPFWLIEEHWEP